MNALDFQPEYWCGSRPCSECGDMLICALVDVDRPSLNAIGIVHKLSQLENSRKARFRKERRYA